MTAIVLSIGGAPSLEARKVEGYERLGECPRFEIELAGPATEPVMPRDVLYQPCTLLLGSRDGSRAVAGVVTRFAVVMSDHAGAIAYRMTLQSRFALLELSRLSRTFSDETIPAIIEKVVGKVGFTVKKPLVGTYDPMKYVVQYQETDAAFVRRLCEEHGLYFRFEASDQDEVFVLEDDSTGADAGLTPSLTVASRTARAADAPIAWAPRARAVRRTGMVTRKDYDVDHPTAPLSGSATAGSPAEQELDFYQAPGGFLEAGKGDGRAKLLLEALRADAALLAFKSPCFTLAPGELVSLVEEPSYQGLVRPAGDHVIVEVKTHWRAEVQSEGDGDHVEVLAVPQAVFFRLAMVTPRPHIAGVQSCYVAGTKGEEIDPDALGRVYLRFHWDVHGEEDPRDNPPFRVMQPQAPGGLVVPRVDWEVFCSFEDGDPTRPMVLGRSYNKKQPPPVALPANKTVTSIATDSSPGKGARTVIQFDDAAGREHLLWNAPFDMTSTIANNRKTDTNKNLNELIGANLTENVGALDDTSVHLALLGGYGTRGLNVGALQKISVGGNMVNNIGPERVVVLGALAEQVGNPVNGVKQLAWGAAMAGVGMLGTPGMIGAAALGLGRGIYEGYQKGGEAGAMRAAWMGGAGMALSFVPGGDAFTAGVLGSGWANAWDHGRPAPGPMVPGGGGAGASGGDGAAVGPGPGYRNMNTDSLYVEIVGARYGIATPGAISWCTLGGSGTIIGGSHTSSARTSGIKALGGMAETLGSLNITAKKAVSRKVTGAYRANVTGPLTVKPGGEYRLSSKTSMTLDVTGTLQCNGGTVTFKVGGSEISASSSGVKIKAGNIKIKGMSQQGGSLTHM
jgi:type VI secretion system secreted protein VgrG